MQDRQNKTKKIAKSNFITHDSDLEENVKSDLTSDFY